LLYVTAFGKIKNEEIFVRFSRYKTESNELGKQQFFDHQSQGKKPHTPDPYYVCLDDGKTQFDLMVQEYKKLYDSDDWWGWDIIYHDWKDELWLLPYLFKWHPNFKNK
jgi:hypothetical protein